MLGDTSPIIARICLHPEIGASTSPYQIRTRWNCRDIVDALRIIDVADYRAEKARKKHGHRPRTAR